MKDDYYRMAVAVAQRVQRFLNLPTTIITDETTLASHGAGDYKFDHTIVVEPDRNNHLKNAVWINKNRYRVYDLTPYDDTLVLDTDYMINSSRLLQIFEQPSDFCCYRTARYIGTGNATNEMIGKNSHSTYWATVMRFTRTERTRDLFEMIKLIQENYVYYAELHGFLPYTYRNDHALTIALHTVNGHMEIATDFIIGELQHIGSDGLVERVDDTTYNIKCDISIRGRLKKSVITVKDQDFHMLNKDNYMSLIV
jgi:hypothetical protein